MIIEQIKEYLLTCPFITIPIYTNESQAVANSISITTKGQEKNYQFINSDPNIIYRFTLYFRLEIKNDKQRTDNITMLENIYNWIIEQNNQSYIELDNNIIITAIEATNNLLIDKNETTKTGLYQIDMEIHYLKQ